MAFQKVEFEFPEDENKTSAIEIEDSGEVEIDVSGKKTKDDFVEDARTGTRSKDKRRRTLLKMTWRVEVVDDTPKADRNRKASEPPPDVTDEELG